MKTAVVYYSFKGSTKKYAEALAAGLDADIFEVKEAKARNTFDAYFNGSREARMQKSVILQGCRLNLEPYEKIIIAAPVWAGMPAPAFNSIADILPIGKRVEIVLISGGGQTKAHDKIKALISKKSPLDVSIKDIRKANI